MQIEKIHAKNHKNFLVVQINLFGLAVVNSLLKQEYW